MSNTKYLKVSNLFGEEGFEAEVCFTSNEAMHAMLQNVASYTGIPVQTLENSIQANGVATDNHTYSAYPTDASVNCKQGWHYRGAVIPMNADTNFCVIVITDETTFSLHEFADMATAHRFMTQDFANRAHINPDDVYMSCIDDCDVIDMESNGMTFYCDENGGAVYNNQKYLYFSQVFYTQDISQLL